MKICKNCNQQLDDLAVFCPVCGEKLVNNQEIQNKQSTQTGGSETGTDGNIDKSGILSGLKNKVEEWDDDENVLFRWLPTICAVVGLIVAWEWSTSIGFALAVSGTLCGCFSKNKVNRTIALVVGIVTILLCLICGI